MKLSDYLWRFECDVGHVSSQPGGPIDVVRVHVHMRPFDPETNKMVAAGMWGFSHDVNPDFLRLRVAEGKTREQVLYGQCRAWGEALGDSLLASLIFDADLES